MFGSNILEIALGVISLFLLLSLIASAANELIEGFMKKRAKDLETGIISLVGSKDAGSFVTSLYNHGLINSLFRGDYETAPKKELPSYIPSRNFALAVIDLAKNPPGGAVLPENIKTALHAFESAAAGKEEKYLKSVEDWYNSAMDRVSGWYKRRTQLITFTLGIALAVGVNADCIGYAKRLSTDTSLRQNVVAYAQSAAKDNLAKDGSTIEKLQNEMKNLDSIGLLIGWEKVDWSNNYTNAQRILGWLLTSVAVSLGAPFWFDTLNKIMVIRSTVKPYEKSREEGPKDPSRAKKSEPDPTTSSVT